MKQRYRICDDGEPNGTAGIQIYNQLRSYGLYNILLIVVCYFGGTKLGVPGPIQAYRELARDCLRQAEIIDKTLEVTFELQYDYKLISTVMHQIKKNQLILIKNQQENDCKTTISLRFGEKEKKLQLFGRFKNLKINQLVSP